MNEVQLNGQEIVLLKNQLSDQRSQSNDSQGQLLPLQHEVNRLQHDNSFLDERVKSLEAELQEKNRLYLDEKTHSNSLKLELNATIKDLTNQLEHAKSQLHHIEVRRYTLGFT